MKPTLAPKLHASVYSAVVRASPPGADSPRMNVWNELKKKAVVTPKPTMTTRRGSNAFSATPRTASSVVSAVLPTRMARAFRRLSRKPETGLVTMYASWNTPPSHAHCDIVMPRSPAP